MGRWYKWNKWLLLSIILPMLIVVIWPGSRVINLLSMIWIGIVLYIYFHKERSHQESTISQTIRSTQKQSICTMNHHRHDWMNDLQVLYGYIRLKKLDRCIEYVERIKGKMTTESSIAKLEEPMLVSYLQSFRTRTSHFSLVVDFLQSSDEAQSQAIVIQNESVSQLIISILNAYRMHVESNSTEEQQLIVKFHKKAEGLNIIFELNGEIVNEQQWKNKIEQQLKRCKEAMLISAAIEPRKMEFTFSST